MCRVLSYLGNPISLEPLLYQTDNSFIKQSYHPKYMSHLLNLAGFGLVAWENHSFRPQLPFIYKTSQLPFYDENLRNLASKIKPQCFLAHIRGVTYSEKQIVSNQNVHPFIFEDTNLAFAHNGSLIDFEDMKFDLINEINPKYRKNIHGTTDSEWIYAIFVSQFKNPLEINSPKEIVQAFLKTLQILKKVREKNHISAHSAANLFISNGKFLAATRFVFDFGNKSSGETAAAHFTYHSLWYTEGEEYGIYEKKYKMKPADKKASIIIASEPLTEDTSTWEEVPEYTIIVAQHHNGEMDLEMHEINL